MRTITLRYPDTCAGCGADLPAGTRVRYYGRRAIYCAGDHVYTDARSRPRDGEPLGLNMSRYDRYGVYTHDGERIGSTCRCEDYPCCGH